MKKIVGLAGLLVAAWSILPVYWVLNLSFQRRLDIYTVPPYFFPPVPTVDDYLRAVGILKTNPFGSSTGLGLVPQFTAGIQNSLIIATLVMALTMLLCIPAGYAFARFSFRFRSLIFFIIIFARSLPPIATTIPYYQFYKTAGLLGTIPGLALVHMTLTVPLTTWVLSGFFSSLPVELDKQARMDGCSRARLFRSVLIPIAAPGLAAVAVLSWLTSWNEFIFALLLAYSNDLYTVAPALAAPLIGYGSDIELYSAFASISLVPAVIAAIILQRYMTRLKIVDPLTFRVPT
ncbi:MAG: carbohydrate ABC transporter permease [Thaumarchaeota archaeon]|nr:carbohydrate ABC transporter permease [Nitrososphaerota archaeon]